MSPLDTLQYLLTEQYAEWRTNPAVDRSEPTAEFVAHLAQHVIALVAIQQGTRRDQP